MATLDSTAMAARAAELLDRAKSAGLNSIHEDVDRLPDGDDLARVAFLANALDIDLGVALDMSHELDSEDD